MKLSITYLLNKRSSLPNIFEKYSLPVFQKYYSTKLTYIHHNIHISDPKLESNREDESGLLRVREFLSTREHISHKEINPELYLLPSCKIALSLTEELHLWLEDDAIVYDPLCYLWKDLMKDSEVGLFRHTSDMFNCAFLLTKKEYDDRLLGELENYKDDGLDYPNSSYFENLLYKISHNHCVLHPYAAIRHHPRGPWKCTCLQVKQWLQENIPDITEEDLSLLHHDFQD